MLNVMSPCFLCLRDVSRVGDGDNGHKGTSGTFFSIKTEEEQGKDSGATKISLRSICRYLEVNPKIKQSCHGVKNGEKVEKVRKTSDCFVTLCIHCSGIITPLSNLCMELEVLEMKVKHRLKQLCGILEESESADPSSPPILKSPENTEDHHAKFLRKEIKKKCKTKLNGSMPKVQIIKDASLAVLALLQRREIPVMTPFAPEKDVDKIVTSTIDPLACSQLSFDEPGAEHSSQLSSTSMKNCLQVKSLQVDKKGVHNERSSESDSHEKKAASYRHPSKCEICGKVFKLKDSLRRHKKLKHGEGVTRTECEISGSTFLKEHSHLQHKKTNHTQPSTNPLAFFKKTGLLSKCNVGDRVFQQSVKCDVCGEIVLGKHSLWKHMKRYHQIIPKSSSRHPDQDKPTKVRISPTTTKEQDMEHPVEAFKVESRDGNEDGLREERVKSFALAMEENSSTGLCTENSTTISLPPPNRMVACDVCGKQFQLESNLWKHKETKHQETNGESQLESCTLCDPPFTVPKRMKNQHATRYHLDNWFLSSKLPHLTISEFKDYCEHIVNVELLSCTKSHRDDNGIQIRKCKYPVCSFASNMYQLRHHICSDHPGILSGKLVELQRVITYAELKSLDWPPVLFPKDPPRSKVSRPTFTCDICEREFQFETVLSKHKTKCVGSASSGFECLVCGKCFTLRLRLNKHMKIAHSECEVCGQKFLSVSSLLNHQKEHHADDSLLLKCTICGKVFHHKQSLWRHKKMAHEGHAARFECDVCGVTFLYRASLLRHKRLKHEQQQRRTCEKRKEKAPMHQKKKSLTREAGALTFTQSPSVVVEHRIVPSKLDMFFDESVADNE